MTNTRLILLTIPTILVTLVLDFIPWGLVTAAATVVLYGIAVFFPVKSLVRNNASLALKGLNFGDLKNAKYHAETALKHAESTSGLAVSDIDLIQTAYENVASALIDSGQEDAGIDLRKRGKVVIDNLLQRKAT